MAEREDGSARADVVAIIKIEDSQSGYQAPTTSFRDHTHPDYWALPRVPHVDASPGPSSDASPAASIASEASNWDTESLETVAPAEDIAASVGALSVSDTPKTGDAVDKSEENGTKVQPEEPLSAMLIAQTLELQQKELEGLRAFIAQKTSIELCDHTDQVTTPAEYAAGAHLAKLQDYLQEVKLARATFNVDRFPPKHCVVQVHIFTFNGIPAVMQTLKECLEETAKKALAVLMTLDMAIEENYKEPIHTNNRILGLVYESDSGVGRTHVPSAYSKKYTNELTTGWAERFLAKAKEVLTVTVLENNEDVELWKPLLVARDWERVLAPVPLVWRTEQLPRQRNPLSALCPPGSEPRRPMQRTRTTQPPREFGQVAAASAGQDPQLVVIEGLKLVPQQSCAVHVNFLAPNAHIWVRATGEEYGPKFDKMKEEMCSFYAGKSHVEGETLIPTVGGCYAAFVHEAWYRVMLTDLQPSGVATMFLVDVGSHEKLLFRACTSLAPCFAHLPALAVCCTLSGFQDFACNPVYLENLNQLVVNQSFMAEVLSVEGGNKVTIHLVGIDDMLGRDINYMLAEKLAAGTNLQRIVAVSQVLMVRVPHVDQHGCVWVRVEDDGQKLLGLMSTQLEHKLKRHPPQPITHVLVGSQTYFACLLNMERSVYRVMALMPPTPTGMVLVHLIDQGDKAMIPMSCLCELQKFFTSLWRLPQQVMQVHLADLPKESFSRQMAERLEALVPADMFVLMKVVQLSVVPVVELFKRILPDNMLVSVNNTLALDPTLVAIGMTAAGIPRPDMGFCQLGAPAMLSPPMVPPVGSQFDIHVPIVSNPNNFMVQPWNTFYYLQKMMFDMQQAYSAPSSYEALAAAEVKPGMGYAAQHPDGNWYRVEASSQVINGDSVLSTFADYGDLQVLQLANMRHLAPQFCELPSQAIRANLYGIKPKHQDWSVKDCIVFQRLVNEHQFVSIVMEKPADSDNCKEASVSLKLIDTSGPEDVYIDQTLVSQGMAEYTHSDLQSSDADQNAVHNY